MPMISQKDIEKFNDPFYISIELYNTYAMKVSDLMVESWKHEKKYYWWYITDKMKKVVYMGEAQKEHTVQCTNATMIKIG